MRAVADVEALVFDVFGTVVDWRGGVASELAAFLARHAPDVDPVAFADAWRRRYSPAMEEVRSGRRPFTRLDVLHLENLAAILPEFGIDPVAIPPSELEALNLAWRRLDPWPDAVPGLTRLKRRFIIAPGLLKFSKRALRLKFTRLGGLNKRFVGRRLLALLCKSSAKGWQMLFCLQSTEALERFVHGGGGPRRAIEGERQY